MFQLSQSSVATQIWWGGPGGFPVFCVFIQNTLWRLLRGSRCPFLELNFRYKMSLHVSRQPPGCIMKGELGGSWQQLGWGRVEPLNLPSPSRHFSPFEIFIKLGLFATELRPCSKLLGLLSAVSLRRYACYSFVCVCVCVCVGLCRIAVRRNG